MASNQAIAASQTDAVSLSLVGNRSRGRRVGIGIGETEVHRCSAVPQQWDKLIHQQGDDNNRVSKCRSLCGLSPVVWGCTAENLIWDSDTREWASDNSDARGNLPEAVEA